MKNITLFTCFILFMGWGLSTTGQNSLITKGDKAFKIQNYPDAIYYYDKAFEIVKNNPEKFRDRGFIERLGDSYRFTNQYKKAAECYDAIKTPSPRLKPSGKSPVVIKPKTLKEIRILQGDMLLRDGKIIAAREVFTAIQPANDPERLRMLKCCNFADSCKKLNLPEIIVQPMVTINSKGSDFSLGKSGDDLIFASNRIQTEGSVIEGINNQEFTDLYKATLTKGSITPGKPQLLKGDINSTYNDGAFSQLAGTDWALITQCKPKPDKCKIFKVTSAGDKWNNISVVTIDGMDENIFSYGHPSLSPGGKVYFSSDRTLEGKAGKNIFRGDYEPLSNNISNIREVGSNINTDGDEIFPCIWKDSILFFASTGHVGSGGLDLYKSTLDDGIFEDPVNLGAKVNTYADDFSVIVNDNLRGGYFCSSRDNDTRGDDIYYSDFTIVDPIKIRVMNFKTKRAVENAEIRNYQDEELKESFSKYTDKEGRAKLYIGHLPDEQHKHKLLIKKTPEFESQTIEIPCRSDDEIVVYLKLKDTTKYVNITGKVFDANNNKPIYQAKVELYKGLNDSEESVLLKDTLTDKDGEFWFMKVPCDEDYHIKVGKYGYYSNSHEFSTPADNKPDEIVDLGTIKLVPTEPPVWDTIFFEFDKSNLLPASIEKLKTMAKYFNLTKDIKTIVIESHCDEVGSLEYNDKLSERRGLSVFEYLTHGIGEKYKVDPSIFQFENWGKRKLLYEHAKNPSEHQMNRRTVFKAILFSPNSNQLRPEERFMKSDIKDKVKEDNEKIAVGETRTQGETQQLEIGVKITSSANPKDTLVSKNKTLGFRMDAQGQVHDSNVPGTKVFQAKTGIVYRVQIAASKKPVNVNEAFKPIADLIAKYGIFTKEEGGYTKYQIGEFTSSEEAYSLRDVLSRNYKGCFVDVINK
jgi:outer membrane protein OmpA-like peptidoglycan-associated protein